MSFDEQVHLTFGFVRRRSRSRAARWRTSSNARFWLADARDFVRFNEIYRTYFAKESAGPCIFPMKFMFDVKVEIRSSLTSRWQSA